MFSSSLTVDLYNLYVERAKLVFIRFFLFRRQKRIVNSAWAGNLISWAIFVRPWPVNASGIPILITTSSEYISEMYDVSNVMVSVCVSRPSSPLVCVVKIDGQALICNPLSLILRNILVLILILLYRVIK